MNGFKGTWSNIVASPSRGAAAAAAAAGTRRRIASPTNDGAALAHSCGPCLLNGLRAFHVDSAGVDSTQEHLLTGPAGL